MGNQKQQIALEIAKQLGDDCLFLIGTKKLLGNKNSLIIRFTASPKWNYMKITLNSLDLYDLTIQKIHNMNVVREEKREGLYNDQLHDAISEITGLATVMPRITQAN